jgi:hypothetical protein
MPSRRVDVGEPWQLGSYVAGKAGAREEALPDFPLSWISGLKAGQANQKAVKALAGSF